MSRATLSSRSVRDVASTAFPTPASSSQVDALETISRAGRLLEPQSVHQPSLDSARQPEPSVLVLNEPSCYQFRVLDPRLPLRSDNRWRFVYDLPLTCEKRLDVWFPNRFHPELDV